MSDNQQPADTAVKTEMTFPLIQKLNISYSPYEDRLVVKAPRPGTSPVTLLWTRRMTVLLLQQMLERLADMSDLGKTPSEYWHDVLQMGHQQAMQAKQANDSAEAAKSANLMKDGDTGQASPAVDGSPEESPTEKSPLFLATELAIQVRDKQLTLAFKGLPMPESMTEARPHSPVLAIPLQLENVHQLIELLINRAGQAQWHLPVDLPWLSADSAAAPAGIRRDN